MIEYVCYNDTRTNQHRCRCGHKGTDHYHETHDRQSGEYTAKLGCTKCNDCDGFSFIHKPRGELSDE